MVEIEGLDKRYHVIQEFVLLSRFLADLDRDLSNKNPYEKLTRFNRIEPQRIANALRP